METHGTWQKAALGRTGVEPSWNVPGSLPEWKDCVVDRARSMFERDKNHAAVLIWSCGNESYAGEDILAMSQFFHDHDPGRLVHYEGVFHCRAFDAISDMESRMYAKPWEIREYLESHPKKPFILCEYMHDMGNSLGGMESYVRLADEFDQYQGGFIWDYMDQALRHTDALGRSVLGYGGDFADRNTDYNFSGNGIVYADGAEKPAMQDVRYWYDTPARRAAHDARNAAAAARADRDAAKAQAARKPGTLTVTEGDGNLGVRGDGFEILFSVGEAGPSSLTVNGSEWLWRAPRPAFWRAATDNDRGCGFPQKAAAWLAADVYLQNLGFSVLRKSADGVQVRYTYGVPTVPGAKAELTYTVEPQGTLLVEAVYHGVPGAPELPCFGVKFQTFAPVARTLWTGLSGETYPDRCKGGVFGCHEEVPHIEPALVPQDCGLHVDTRQFTLEQHNACGQTAAALTIEQADAPFAFSALPNTAQEIAGRPAHHRAARHGPHERDDPGRSPRRRRHRQLGHRCGGALPRQRGRGAPRRVPHRVVNTLKATPPALHLPIKIQAARVSLTRAALLSYARLIQAEHLLQLGLGAGQQGPFPAPECPSCSRSSGPQRGFRPVPSRRRQRPSRTHSSRTARRYSRRCCSCRCPQPSAPRPSRARSPRGGADIPLCSRA